MSSKVENVYAASTPEEQRAAYDDWAQTYEAELCAMGYRLPALIAAVFARYVPVDVGPILDAGCGGGIQSEPLALLGYGPFTGIDLSEGMLEVAKRKGIYSDLKQMALGGRLDFEDDTFAAVISSGTITPGHAPPEAFDDLTRVARRGALIVFSLRDDETMDPAYADAIRRLETAGLWREVFTTEPIQTMPYGEPHIYNRVHVYEVR